jgi:hypothetical protein
MRTRLSLFSLVLAACLLLSLSTVWAADLSGKSSTYLRLRENLFGDEVAQAYEYLRFNVEDIGGKDLSLYADGWIRQDLTNNAGSDTSFDQDLDYAYFRWGGTWGSSYGKGLIDAGRVLVFEGVASEQIDGVYAKRTLWKGMGVSLFGGVPVDADFDDRTGDSIYGGRLYRESPGNYGVGVSFLNEENDSREFRKEAGVDLWFRLWDSTFLQGISSYNARTGEWMEHSYNLSANPFGGLRLNGEFSYIDYENFFQATDLSAFDFAHINMAETLTILGASASYPITGSVTGTVAYKNYNYDIAGSADYYGADLTFVEGKLVAGASFYRMDGGADDLRYYQYRVFASKRVGLADLTVDFLDVDYDRAINGKDNAFTIVGAAGYDLSPRYRVGANLEYSENPYFDEELKALLKFIYSFGKEA